MFSSESDDVTRAFELQMISVQTSSRRSFCLLSPRVSPCWRTVSSPMPPEVRGQRSKVTHSNSLTSIISELRVSSSEQLFFMRLDASAAPLRTTVTRPCLSEACFLLCVSACLHKSAVRDWRPRTVEDISCRSCTGTPQTVFYNCSNFVYYESHSVLWY